MTTTAASEKKNERARNRRRRKLLRRCPLTFLSPNTCTSTAAWCAVSALASVPYFGGVPSSIAARCHLSICPDRSLSLIATGALDGSQKLHRSTTDNHPDVQQSLHWTKFPARPDHVAKSPVNNQMRTIKVRHKSGGRSYYVLSTGTRSSKR